MLLRTIVLSALNGNGLLINFVVIRLKNSMVHCCINSITVIPPLSGLDIFPQVRNIE